MENNNLTPENEDLQNKPVEQGDTTETQETSAPQSEQNNVAQEEATAAPIGDNLTVIPTPEPPAKKSKTGLFVGIAVALVAALVVVGVGVMGQSPEKVVNKAFEAVSATAMKQEETLQANLPMLTKSNELAAQSRETKTEVKLNSIDVPELSPLVSMVLSGTTISGSTISIPETNTYSNSYSLSMLGQKVGTLNLFNSPTIFSAGIPEILHNAYYLDVDELVKSGKTSYLFGVEAGVNAEALKSMADMYKSYMTSLGSMNTETSKEMLSKIEAIFAETLVGVEYGSVKVDGKKLYTMTIPADSVNAMITSLMKYVYMESPMSGSMLAAMPGGIQAEYGQEIDIMISDIISVMPASPTVVTMSIVKGNIDSMDILTEGTNADAEPMHFNMKITDFSGMNSNVVMNIEAGSGMEKAVVDMTVNTSYADKVMKAALDLKASVGDSDNIFNMVFDYTLDGNKQTDNMGFNMDYVVNSPAYGNNVGLKLSALGDYYTTDNTVTIAMDDIDYGITVGTGMGSGSDVTINMNLGMNMTTAPFAGELTAHPAVDLLTINEDDLAAIYDEGSASFQQIAAMFLGKLAA